MSSLGEVKHPQPHPESHIHFSKEAIEKDIKLEHDSSEHSHKPDSSMISAYARLDFDNYTFFVQTLQVILGRKSNDELLSGSQHSVDVHLSSKKAISRRHAKIFYNFGTQRFELSILGRNGAFVDDLFIEKGMTIPLVDGTKIQIGDISFLFILPSVDSNTTKEADPNKPFDPSDAISLRTSLYSTSPPKKTNDNDNDKKKPLIRRPSRSIPRRLSEARRKSLAVATDEEIDTILVELGVKSLDEIDAIDEDDPEYVDAQIRAILGDGHQPQHESAIIDDEEEEDMKHLETFQEGEEDELDQLVKQHNMEQGVSLDQADLDRGEMSMSVIDDEIVNLAPLINAHNQDNNERSAPLMGKPATPRMGKPASIQPPSSRLYGRPVGGGKNQVIDMRLAALGSQMSGLPTHLVSQGGPGDYSLKLAQGNLMHQQYNRPYYGQRQTPELLVPIHTITKTLQPLAEISIDKITVNKSYQLPPVHIPKIIGKPDLIPRTPKRRNDFSAQKKPVKNVYTMNDIPEHYRTKPTLAFPVMIINVIKFKGDPKGLSMNDIYEGIKEIYPYYKYCPDGWQSVVVHNVRLNKLFKLSLGVPRKDMITEGGELQDEEERWTIDENFVQEKEKVRKKQQEIAAQKAKEAAIKAEELKQKQRLEMQQSISQNIVGRDFHSPYGMPMNPHSQFLSQSQLIAQLHHKNNQTSQKPKTIAEIASEIRRDGQPGSKTPVYFKPQSPPASEATPVSGQSGSPPNIKAQLAANRSQYSQSPPEKPAASPSMNQDTKKSLTYLQKELFTLYKSRKLSYNTATTTEIITKALATTIAQVNVIGSKAGVGNNALSFLVERAPQQVSKILDIALTKSIKEKQGISSSRNTSGGTTPNGTPGPSQLSSPKPENPGVKPNQVAANSDIVKQANQMSPDKEKSPGFSKPPAFKGSPEPSKPASLGRPQTYSKPSGLVKPPQFVSNKPRPEPMLRPGYKPEDRSEKRLHEEEEGSNKVQKTE